MKSFVSKRVPEEGGKNNPVGLLGPLSELKMPESADFYNVTTLAQHLGVSTQTIRRWIRNGKLPAPIVLSPTVRRWKKAEIESWLQTFEQSASMKSSSPSHA